MKTITVFFRFIAGYWQSVSQYRLGAVLWIVNGLITPLILMGIWLAVARSRAIGLSSAQIVTYFLLVILITRLTQSWVAEDLSFLIKEGKLSQYLLKPISFIIERLAKDQALRLLRLLTLLPLIILVSISPLNLILSPHPSTWLYVIFIILVATLCNFLLEVLVGLFTFWLGDAFGAFLILFMVQEILSGVVIPFRLMPETLQAITRFFPFYAFIGLPADLLIGAVTPAQSLSYVSVLMIWVIGLIVAVKSVYARLIKKYTAVGI